MTFSSDDYYCTRCEQPFKWERLITTKAGNLLCSSCVNKLSNEPTRKCPVDGIEMEKKRVLDRFLIDYCNDCGGTWFDKGELKIVQQEAIDAGASQAIPLLLLLGVI
jgi:hypothetical protein